VSKLKYLDKDKLIKILQDFSSFSGLASLAVDKEGKDLTPSIEFTDFCKMVRSTPKGNKRCVNCDLMNKGIYTCHAGLIDASSDIIIQNKFVGFVKCGQVCFSPIKEEETRQLALEIGLDPEELVKASKKIKKMERSKLEAALKMLSQFVSMYSDSMNQNHELFELNNSLNTLVNTIPCGITKFIFTGENLKLSYFTKRVPLLLGYDEKEYKDLVDKNGFESLIHPNDKEKFFQFMNNSIDNFSFNSYIFRLRHKNSNYVWVSLVLKFIGYNDNYPEFYLVSTDMTNRYEARKDRVEISNEKVFVLDSETFELYYANKLSLEDAKDEKYEGKTCYQVFFNRDSKCKRCIVNQNLNNIKNKIIVIPKEGKTLQYSVRKSDWLGRPCFIESVADLTEEYERSKKLEKEQERYRIIVESAGISIVDYDFETKILYFSDSLKKRDLIKTFNKKSLLEIETYRPFIDPRDFKDFKIKFDLFKEKKSFCSCKVRLSFDKGAYRWTFLTIYPNYKEKGINRLIITFKDINEEQQKLYKKEVEKNKILEMALQKANEATKAKTDFLAQMSHDMRTPLNGVIGLTELVLSNLDDRASVRYYLQEIKNSGSYLLMLINDILDLRQIENGKIKLKPSAVNLKLSCQKIINIIKITSENKNLHFSENFQDLPCEYVLIDELRVNQILMNLLNNAMKFTPTEGHVFLNLANEGIENNKLKFIITVQDDGIGMSKPFLSKLFLPFTQENRASDSLQGSGLGLSIVKQLVDIMKGEIKVEAEEGKGSKFTVILNLEVCEKEELLPNLKSKRHFMGCKILLCEDNEINALVARKLLEKKGMLVEIAPNGLVGLQKAKKKKYSAILMDIKMPVMDGLETARRIRKFDEETPIIALSANAYEEDREKSFSAGMNGHLSKPIEKEKLFECLGQQIFKN